MERSIEFLLQSQANQDARIEKLSQQVAQMGRQVEETGRQVAEVGQKVAELTRYVTEIGQQVTQTSRSLEDLAETQNEFMAHITRFIEAQVSINERLLDRQARTDERLNALIGIVERHINEEHGGKA